ncbi:MAG TPA: KGG domain-containing protein [Gemmatimonadaceae bacterium]|nr:KGG domain-containing protein [Gemmatimonadaceae bacterium]
MPNRLGNDDRSDEAVDRERQRDASSDNGGDGDFDSHGAGGRRSNRGFASMDRGKQREIASKGGKAAHAKGTAHEFDSDEARNAGRKGGQAVSRNREHMAMIGRRGGEARGHSRTRTPAQTNTQGSTSGSEGTTQNTRSTLTDREVNLHGAGAGPANGVSASTQGARGTNSSLGGESRVASSGAADRSVNH